jgi:DNA-binding response OmpR family regulator
MAKKILVIEDDKFLQKIIDAKLSKEGYDFLISIDGEEGMKSIKENRPDLILLDIILPGINGFEVLARIKSDPSTSEIPVIILSNLGEKVDIDKALKMGAADYLVKAHFDPQEIIVKMEAVLK